MLGELQATTAGIDPRSFPTEQFDLYSVPSYSNGAPEQLDGSEIGSTKQVVQEGDVLLCKIVPHIRRGWVVPTLAANRQIASGEWIVYREHGFEPEFLRNYIVSDQFHRQFMQTVSGVGGSLMRARPAEAGQITIPYPPRTEQRRIVAKLDILTARLARARKELERIFSLAKHIRERAVRAAFHGQLTRRSRMEADADEGSQAGPHPIPQGWTWTTLGCISDIRSGVTLGKVRPVTASLIEVPYLRVANVQRGALELSVIKVLSVTQTEAASLELRSGDILLNEGGDRDKLGRGWVWEGQIPRCIHQNHVFRARLHDLKNSPFYVSLYANEFGQDYFLQHGTQTTNLASISKAKLSALPVPLAPPDEQHEIVRRVNGAFAHADRLEAEAARARALLDRLEAALLAKAFRGELVPQDPDDEPASVLLDRIRASRAAAPKPKRGRRVSPAAPP